VNKTFLIGGSYITEIDNPSSTARIDGVHDVTFFYYLMLLKNAIFDFFVPQLFRK
jgi:hypothetical protein